MSCADTIVIQNSIKTLHMFRSSYLDRLRVRGDKVLILAPNDSELHRDQLLKNGFVVPRIPKRLLGLPYVGLVVFGYFHVAIALLRNRRALVIVHFAITGVIFSPLFFFYSRTVLSIEGLGRFRRGFGLEMLRVLVKWPGLVLTTNKDEYIRLKPKKGMIFGGIGIDFDVYSDLAPRTGGVIYYVGRITRDKGFAHVISLLELIKKKQLQLRIVVYGDVYPENPSSFTEIELNRIKASFPDMVDFKGFVNSPLSKVNDFGVLLQPSRREGFPVSVMEANAKGLPAVCFRVPGCEDAVVEGLTGHLVEYGDVKGLLRKILDILDWGDGERVAKMLEIRRYALRSFDRNLAADRFIMITDKVR